MKLVCCLALALLPWSLAAAETPPANVTPEQIATTPAPRNDEQWWVQRHQQRVDLTQRGGVDLAFLGDSITQGWEDQGKPVWEKFYAPRKSANFGFSGDRTEHVLWRLDNGELVGLTPKLIVMMIGTNNLGHPVARQTPQSTAVGVKAILAKLREKLPNSRILLIGIFPRSEQSTDPLRVKVNETNRLLQPLADGKHVHFLDIGARFLQPTGVMSKEIMRDFLHPGPNGYEIWAEAIESKVAELLK
ncbi:MAG: platelet-activating factor acetylhydrolase IB subunit [Verrucomicrobiales bacterium]